MLKNLPPPKKILQAVKKKDYVVYRNTFSLKILREMKFFWIKYFEDKSKFKSTDLYGSSRSLGDSNYNSIKKEKGLCMMRRTEFPWNKPIHDTTHRLIFELNQIRNIALNLDRNHGLLFSPDLQVFFSQINNYPTNEGEMFPHKDTKRSEMLLSCMFNITHKNIDFEKGGLYLMSKNKKIDIDSLMSPCSIIFYNGNLIHGVDKVISNKGFGRIAGYPMKQFFLSRSIAPNYIKTITRIDNAIRRKLIPNSALNQGNSAFHINKK